MKTCRIQWIDGRQLLAESGSGHAMVLDTTDPGRDTGPSPMDLMLIGTTGCTAIDIAFILNERMHCDLRSLRVAAEADVAEEYPEVFTAIRLRYTITGRGIKAGKIERAVELSMTKYCSAAAMVSHTASISAAWTYRDELSDEEQSGEFAQDRAGHGGPP